MGKEKLVCNYDNISEKHYSLTINPDPQEPASVIGGGYVFCGKNFRVERTGFPHNVIEFIVSGEGSLLIQGKKHPLYSGTVFFYGPHVSHKILSSTDNPLIKHYVIFTGSKLIEMIRKSKLGKTPLHTSYPVRLHNMFENLLLFGNIQSQDRAEICVLELMQIILFIEATTITQKDSRSPSWQTYLRIHKHIEQNFQKLHGLDQIAQECHANKVYLCRLFKRYSQETPLQMLMRLKMRQAADTMINDPSLSIKEAAFLNGYSDPYYFSRVFKRVFGVCPEKYLEGFRPN